MEINAMCGGVVVEIDACEEGWRCCVMAACRVLRRGSLEGVVGLWRGGLAGGERVNEMRGRERVIRWGNGDLGFFFL